MKTEVFHLCSDALNDYVVERVTPPIMNSNSCMRLSYLFLKGTLHSLNKT